MDEGAVSSPEQSGGPQDMGRESAAEAASPQASDESSTFARCARCGKAEEVDRSAGVLVCSEYNMRVNAEADEIPDDCVAFTPRESAGG